jgi:serine/threonin/tyrosin kinase-like protein
VVKRNNLAYHDSYLQYFERLAIHNWLFPESKLHFIGFDEDDGILKPVTSQPVIEVDKGGTDAEQQGRAKEAEQAARAHMQALGFRKVMVNGQEDWYHPESGTVVEDLHSENVVLDKNRRAVVFDPTIYTVPKIGSALERALIREGLLNPANAAAPPAF